MPPAVIELNFDPYLRLAGQAVRWETLALAGVILLVLVLTGLLAGRSASRSAPDGPGARRLRRDDMLFIVLGIVPGAVIGGRLSYVLIHFDYYHANPGLIFDPSSGGLALTGAVVLGTLTGIYVARLLDAPVGRWLDLAAIGLIIGLGLGKLAQRPRGQRPGLAVELELGDGLPRPRPMGGARAGAARPPGPGLRGDRRRASSCSTC